MAGPDFSGEGSGTLSGAEDVRRLRELGDAELKQGRPRRAVEAYRKALALDPRDSLSLAGMGIAVSHRDGKQALKLLSAAYRLDPQAPRIANPLAAALLRNGRLDAAAQLVSRRGSPLSYAVASTVMRRYAENPAARNVPAIRNGIRSLQRLLDLLGRSDDAAEVTLGIFANHLHPLAPWREQALDRCTEAQLKRWVETSGVERLKAVQDAGQGAILVVSHLAVERVATVLLGRMGFKLNTLEYENRLAIHGIAGAALVKVWEIKETEGFMLRVVYEARKALQRGEIFLVAGDGFHGGSEVPLAFLGRRRAFKAGFAELAIAARVPAFPVFCTVDIEGRIRLELREPLEDGQDGSDRRERVARLVGRYAALLEDCWRRHPGNVAWYHLPRYFALPPAAPSSPAAPESG
jgi:lauroyl/myristoyl acyltransferase